MPHCGTDSRSDGPLQDGFAVANLGGRRFARDGLASRHSLETFER